MIDEDWRSVPVFGAGPEGHPRTIRPSAYGLILDEADRIALVRTPAGVWLLGGGIESNETPAEAVIREAQEECGLVVTVGTFMKRAVQFSHSANEGILFEKRSYFLSAALVSVSDGGGEADHTLLWIAVERAHESITDESHRWAVGELIAQASKGEGTAVQDGGGP